MKLITVEASFAAKDINAAIGLFTDQAQTVRKMSGCAHYEIYCKPSNDGIAIIQHWETMKQFDVYRASETFARLGAGLRPKMTSAPVTTVAEIDKQ